MIKEQKPLNLHDQKIFEFLYVCRRYPYFEIVEEKAPEDQGKVTKLMKRFANEFALDRQKSEDELIKVKKERIKDSIWVYPKNKPVDDDMKREMKYIIDNCLERKSYEKIGSAKSDLVETHLNTVFYSPHSHADTRILIIPLQNNQKEPEAKRLKQVIPGVEQKELLIDRMNIERTSYSMVLLVHDYTIVDYHVHYTDLLICVKTFYPFISFFSKLLTFILSEIKFVRLEQHNKLGIKQLKTITSKEEMQQQLLKLKEIDSSYLNSILDSSLTNMLEQLYARNSIELENKISLKGLHNIDFHILEKNVHLYGSLEGNLILTRKHC